jgi:hypothetical protein
MRRPGAFLALALGVMASAAPAQEFFRCTTPDGKVTYQQAPCPKTDEQRRIDATPANTDFDPSKREELLRKGEEAGKRLEARAAEEERLRREAREREERLERDAQEREAAREPVIIFGWPVHRPPPPSRPPPVPRPSQPPTTR